MRGVVGAPTDPEPAISTEPLATPTGTQHLSLVRQLRGVLAVAPFRRLWITLALSSLGDWLGLLATAVIAQNQVTGSTAKGAAFGGVVVVRLLPALLLAPLAGVVADRFDRRVVMVVSDIVRFVLFASIPVLGSIGWTLSASFLIEVAGMFWVPAKEAAVPNLIRRDQLESANQLSLFTTYGLAPIFAALLFAGLSGVTTALAHRLPYQYLDTNRVDLALYFNALTFLVAAAVVLFIPQISGRRRDPGQGGGAAEVPAAEPAGVGRAIVEGWTYTRSSQLVRGLVIGIAGSLSAGGIVIGVGKFYASSLGGGDATFGLLFGALFIGLGLGMGFGPKLARGLSRRRWFGLSIVLSGTALGLLGFTPFLALAIMLDVLVGLGAGMAYLAGVTLLGQEVEDALRGRIFGFVQSMVRVVLMIATAASSLLVGIGGQRTLHFGDEKVTWDSSRALLVIGGLLAATVGVLALRQMDDRRGVPLLPDLIASLRGHPLGQPVRRGLLVAFEGGEGAGKSTQVRLLMGWLGERGVDCVDTHEPGGTATGERVRDLVLHGTDRPSPRAEALLFAADRADHVAKVISPALAAGQVVVTDRFVDSSLAYQGSGRELPVADVERLSRWATLGLRPDLVVLLDIDPQIGLRRAGGAADADALEGESLAFHQRVRRAFLGLAQGDRRHVVIDATLPPEIIADRVRDAVHPLLPHVLPAATEPLPVVATPPPGAGAPQPPAAATSADEPGMRP